MKKVLVVLLLAGLLTALSVGPAVAAEKTSGSCPAGFSLHEIGEHMDHPQHHKGLVVDLNGNGFLCMKELGNGLHVHVDDVVFTAGS